MTHPGGGSGGGSDGGTTGPGRIRDPQVVAEAWKRIGIEAALAVITIAAVLVWGWLR